MESFILAYLINSASSSFDIITTGLLFKKTGNKNEHNKDLLKSMEKDGAFLGGLKEEFGRRKNIGAVGLAVFALQNIYTLVTHQEAFPLSEFLLFASSIVFAYSGALNLIPLVIKKGRKSNLI